MILIKQKGRVNAALNTKEKNLSHPKFAVPKLS